MFRAHRGIVIVLIAFGALALWYSVTTPLFEAPDELWHFAFVQHVATGHGLPIQSLDNPNQHLARQEGSQPPLYYLLAAGATFWIDTSDYPGIVWENPHYGFNVPGIVNDNKNLFIHTAAESFPYRGAVLAIHLARIISILMGALSVLFTYLLALEIFPDKKYFATSAAAIIAFVPQFIFISSAVSNDSTITAMSALSLWLMARIITRHSPLATRDVIALGIAAGLAALSKVSGAAITPLAVLVLAWVVWHPTNAHDNFRLRLSSFVRVLLVFGIPVALVAGWWYLRNLFLYGELTGTEIMSQIFFARQTPLTLSQLIAQLGEVWETFWVGFGWGNIRVSSLAYTIIFIFVLVSAAGWLKFMIYDLGFRVSGMSANHAPNHKSEFLNPKSSLLVLVLWVGILFIALVRWMMLTQAPHGRLLFPALPATAILLAYGLDQIASFKFQVSGFTHHVSRSTIYVLRFAFPVFLFILAVIAPIVILQPAYSYPPTLSENSIPNAIRRVDIDYGGKMKLIGYEFSTRRAQPGESITLTLYWQSLAAMNDDYSIGIHVLDVNGREIGKRDSYPGHGMLPTRLWYAGQIIRDEYWLAINADAVSGMAQTQVSLYSRATKSDLPAMDARGNSITPFIGQIKIGSLIQDPAPQMQNATNYVFGNQIAMIGYEIIQAATVASPNPGFQVTLYWKRIAPIDNDYKVFIHVVDVSGKMIAQQDQTPVNGTSPTSLWDDGEIIVDRYLFNASGAQKISVGLYRADTGGRLVVTDANGNPIDDHIELQLLGIGR